MTPDDWVYAGLLLASLAAGPLVSHGLRSLAGARAAAVLAAPLISLIGFALCVTVCGAFIWHSALVAAVTALLCSLAPAGARVHAWCAVWCFGYLAFFRTAHWLGFAKPSPHSNAVQLLMTLRMAGVAFEIGDTRRMAQELKTEQLDEATAKKTRLQLKYTGVDPGFWQILLYAYAYPGVLTGPYYRYRTYHDLIVRLSGPAAPAPPPASALWSRLAYAPLYGLLYAGLSQWYYIDYARTDDCLSGASLLYRLYFMFAMFTTFRFRMYFAWVVSECVCIALGLGAYPAASEPQCGQGPTRLEALELAEPTGAGDASLESARPLSFECVHNIDEAGCEFAPTVQAGMRAWNRSVQHWLAAFVYRRVRVRALRLPATMAVSAYWHGIHGGYFLSFLTVPLARHAEDALERLLRRARVPESAARWASWFFKMRVFDYTCMGFLLLSAWDTYSFWASIGFCVHLACGLILAIEWLMTGGLFGGRGRDKAE